MCQPSTEGLENSVHTCRRTKSPASTSQQNSNYTDNVLWKLFRKPNTSGRSCIWPKLNFSCCSSPNREAQWAALAYGFYVAHRQRAEIKQWNKFWIVSRKIFSLDSWQALKHVDQKYPVNIKKVYSRGNWTLKQVAQQLWSCYPQTCSKFNQTTIPATASADPALSSRVEREELQRSLPTKNTEPLKYLHLQSQWKLASIKTGGSLQKHPSPQSELHLHGILPLLFDASRHDGTVSYWNSIIRARKDSSIARGVNRR